MSVTDHERKDLLTADDVEFLTNLANEIKAQDNHGTRTPIYLQVREPKRTFGIDPDYADDTVILMGDESDVECYTLEEAKKILTEHFSIKPSDLKDLNDFEEIKEFCSDRGISATYTGYSHGHEFHEFFLTRSGYEQHMKLNGHNYRNNTGFYVRHLYRNPELERLLSIVEKFATVEVKAE